MLMPYEAREEDLMDFVDLANLGKSVIETSLERAVGAVRFAERQCRKAVETYDFLVDSLPLPLPKMGSAARPASRYEPPSEPLFSSDAPGFDSTSAWRDEPVAAEPPAPTPAPAKPAPKPAPKPAAKPAPKAASKPAPKAASKLAAKAQPKPAKAVARPPETKPVAEAAPKQPTMNRNDLRRMRKADLQKLCREKNVEYKQSDTVKVLIERIIEAGKQS
jgi:outer membrane biosynthesis protein TonB